MISSLGSKAISTLRRCQGIPQAIKMDSRYHVTALREVRLLAGGAQSARDARADAATRSGEEVFRDLTDVVLAASVVFVLAIAAVADVIVVIKEVHIVVQIVVERAQLTTIALRSAESACISTVIKAIFRSAPRLVKRALRIVTARAQLWQSTHFLKVITPGTAKLVP